MPDLTPTPEQEAIVSFVRNEKQSLLVNALAGSAKTTTLVMAAHAMRLTPTISVAFNKKIATEMQLRMPGHVQCATLNSIGHRAWAQLIGKRLTLKTDKVYDRLSELFQSQRPEDREDLSEGFSSMLRAVNTAKSMGYIPKKVSTAGKALTSLEDFQAAVTASSDIEPTRLFWQLIDDTLAYGIADSFAGTIDFSDQLYMSTLFGGNFPKAPVLLVDESQDLSELNHLMLKKMFGGRIIAVGDRNQAVYLFRGAHSQSMEVMKKEFSMEELSLSISFRCPKAVVHRAQFRAPNMKYPDWAAEGHVESLVRWSSTTPPDGSAVICRNNAPLFKAAMHFIRHSRGVKIVGKDIGAGLVKLLKKMGKPDDRRTQVVEAIETWRKTQLDIASKSRHAPIHDRADCLLVFAEMGEDLRAAIAFAEHLFAAAGPIQFMTGHGAKGLEFENVYFLDSFLIPSKAARVEADNGNDDQLQQEYNLNYVIITRSQKNLFYVNSEDLED